MATTYTLNTTVPSGASNSGDVAIGATLTKANTFLEFSFRGGNSNPSDAMLQYTFVSSTGSSTTFDKIRFSRSTVNGGTLTICCVFVTDNSFSVQHYSGTFTGVSATFTLDSAIDTAHGWGKIVSATSGSSFTEDETLMLQLTSTTFTISCSLASPGSTGTFYCVQIISSPYFSVQQVSYAFSANVSTSTNLTITAIDTAKTFIVGSHKCGSSQTARLGEKFARYVLTNSTTVTVTRQVITTAISGVIFVVSLSSTCEVVNTVATFTGTTTPSAGGTLTASRPFNKCFPILQSASNGLATSDVTSDDALDRINVCATLNSLTSGTTCSVTQQRSSTSGNPNTSVALVYFPDQATYLDVTANESQNSSLAVRLLSNLSVASNETQNINLLIRLLMQLNLTNNTNESVNVSLAMMVNLAVTANETVDNVVSLRLLQILRAISNESVNVSILTRLNSILDVNSSTSQDVSILFKLVSQLSVICVNNESVNVAVRILQLIQCVNNTTQQLSIVGKLTQLLDIVSVTYERTFIDDGAIRLIAETLTRTVIDVKLVESLEVTSNTNISVSENIRLVEQLLIESSTRVDQLVDLRLVEMIEIISDTLSKSIVELGNSDSITALTAQTTIIDIMIRLPSVLINRVAIADLSPVAKVIDNENM